MERMEVDTAVYFPGLHFVFGRLVLENTQFP